MNKQIKAYREGARQSETIRFASKNLQTKEDNGTEGEQAKWSNKRQERTD